MAGSFSLVADDFGASWAYRNAFLLVTFSGGKPLVIVPGARDSWSIEYYVQLESSAINVTFPALVIQQRVWQVLTSAV